MKLYDKVYRVLLPNRLSLWVETANFCNLKCEHCFNHIMTRPKGFMGFYDFKKYVVDQNLPDISRISFTGWGENLLNPNIFDMIQYCAEKRINTQMPTNAVNLTEDVADMLLESGVNNVRFSIDGLQDEYETLRKTSYTKVMDNVMMFLDRHKQRNSKVEITFVCVVNDITSQRLKAYREFWSKYGRVEFQRAAHFNGTRTTPCSVIGRTWYIWWNLDVSPCCLDYDGKINLGNLRQSNMKQIKNGERFKMLDSYNRVSPRANELCAQCCEWRGEADIPLEYRFSLSQQPMASVS